MARVPATNGAYALPLEKSGKSWQNFLSTPTCATCIFASYPGCEKLCGSRPKVTVQEDDDDDDDDDDDCGGGGDDVSTCQPSESGILMAAERSKVFVACIDAFRFQVISCSEPFMCLIRRDTLQWHQNDWAFLKKNRALVEEYTEKCNSLMCGSILTNCMVKGPLVMRTHSDAHSVASAICSLKIVQVPISERYEIDGEEVPVVVHITLRHVKFGTRRQTRTARGDGLQAGRLEETHGSPSSDLSMATKLSL